MEKNQKAVSRKKKVSPRLTVIALLLVVCGAVVLLYPLYTNWLYNKDVQVQVDTFRGQVEKQTEDLPFEDLYQELMRRNEQLYLEKQRNLTDPFSYERSNIDLSAYGLEGNVIGFISIPKMDIELPILLGANNENMRLGAVHLTETSYPIGGVNTNCVIAAHRGYSKAAMFRDIEALEIGDEIYIENFRETLVYRVVELRVIYPTDINQLLIQKGRDLVTLITCHPYRHNYQRYVVFCERAESEPEA